ncbi:ester cyclase [Aliarcobacter butzleri]|nr:ester cyclase [Aliarcobacter butzleri]
MTYNGASFFKFKDGKIIDIWVLGDLKTLIQQLS